MLDILKKYTKIAPQAFAQMGFMDAMFATKALLNVKGPVTAKSYNAAVRKLKNIKTDMLCKPWYVGQRAAVPHPEQLGHHRRLQGRQGRPEGEVLRDPAVDQELAQTRVWEKKFKLNTAK